MLVVSEVGMVDRSVRNVSVAVAHIAGSVAQVRVEPETGVVVVVPGSEGRVAVVTKSEVFSLERECQDNSAENGDVTLSLPGGPCQTCWWWCSRGRRRPSRTGRGTS